MHGLIEFFKEGGPFMYLNLVFVVFSFAVVGERSYFLFLVYRSNEKATTQQVDRYLQAGNLEAAAKAVKDANDALSRATRNLMKLFRNGYESPMLAVEEAMLDVRPLVTKRVSWLWSIANIATLIGLIGTILGLIGAFKAVASVGAADRASVLSSKIAEAMNNTAFGLMIAVFCITAHLFLNNQATKTVEAMEHSLFHFVNLHAQWRKGNRSADAAAAPSSTPGAR
jgi:biopolymer transport protein ExbB/TolQ